MRWLRSLGCWRWERLRPKGWLLITTVLLSMLKHIGSRWAGSLWLGKGEGGCFGLESEGGDMATETPPRERTAEVDPVKPLQAKSSPSSALCIQQACIPIRVNSSEKNCPLFRWSTSGNVIQLQCLEQCLDDSLCTRLLLKCQSQIQSLTPFKHWEKMAAQEAWSESHEYVRGHRV